METSLTMKKLYMDIQEKLYYMIPEKWDSIFLYASIFEGINNIESGEMFFYYFPKGILRKEPINVYEIPSKFNIDEEEYDKLAEELYRKIKKLKQEYFKITNKKWTNVTISIENYKFTVEYGYEDLKHSEYSSYDRHIIWRYMYLNTSLNTYNKEEREIINSYLKQYKKDDNKKDEYVEAIYKNRVHNVIDYNKQRQVQDIEPIKKEEKEEQTNTIINQILRY